MRLFSILPMKMNLLSFLQPNSTLNERKNQFYELINILKTFLTKYVFKYDKLVIVENFSYKVFCFCFLKQIRFY